MSVASVLAPEPRFPRYGPYKDSGIEWLGEIPAHWEARPNSALFYERDERGRDDLPILEVSIAAGVRVREFSVERIEQRSDNLGAYKVASRGDIAFNKMRMWQGAVGVAPEDGLVSPDYVVARARDAVVPEYFAKVFRTRPYMDEVYRWSHGIVDDRNRLYWDDFKAILTPSPPEPEQRAIAAFLDRETARIDALVAKKGRLIELLQEQRTALITRAVTKGLDANVPMKDSGVEWLGDTPAHWAVKRVRDLAEALQTGPFGSQLHSSEYVIDGCPVINPANLRNGGLVPDPECTVTEATADRLAHHRLQGGDVLFARRGELGRCGLVTMREARWLCGTGCLRLRIRVEMARPRFLIRLLSTSGVAEWLGLQSVGATMQNLNTSIIGRIPLVVPPLSEQDAIAAFLDAETAKIDALVVRVSEAVDRLKELRSALISAAVTGKIDVRGETA